MLQKYWINKPGFRILQHIAFWVLSFYIFLNLFKLGIKIEKIDYIYTTLFHVFILPPVYINLIFLIPWLRKTNNWAWYIIIILGLIAFFSWVNYNFFANWSNHVLPEYYFISYFGFLQVANFFIVYTGLSSLLKLSKAWFMVSEMQNELLKAEKQKTLNEKELLEMEARALRAQMNPHFIFNCLNSIKALIQNDQKKESILYLIIFSKLIRTLFQNSDKREISLYDEIETCRLYLELEAMRLNNKLSYTFKIEPDLDLKSVMVPALIIQPFIENAIWHGIVPKEKGHIMVTIKGDDEKIVCEIDDDGIGRELSKQNKPATSFIHDSKGIHLSEARLNLEKSLNMKNATIQIIDKQEGNLSVGTKVILQFNFS